ncbi:MAG: Do family serine endopeptidase [Pseudomonadota bacterium]
MLKQYRMWALALLLLAPLAQGGDPVRPAPALALPDFAALVRSQGPAVVNVRVFRSQPARGVKAEPAGEPAPLMPPRESGVGSGFVVSANGVILTNGHVVAGAEKILVRFADKRELPARIVGVDPLTDVAVLKVEARNLPAVTLGDSAGLEVGQWVLAIGAPLGLERTATQGIISALGRTLPNDSYVSFIQTDVPINQGNSGGPLFDLDGRVVGINSQILSSSGGYMGLSFAIPINTAVAVARQIVEKGKASHGWLGVSTQELNLELAQAYGLSAPRGALVTEVRQGGPAKLAGLQAGDIILGLDDTAIVDSADLPPLIGASRPGTDHVLTLLRDGQMTRLSVKVGELGKDGAEREKAVTQVDRLGVRVSNLDAATRQVLGLDRGVLVEAVAPGAATAAGVQPGDLLLKLGTHDLSSVADLVDHAARLRAGQTVPLLVKRQDNSTFVTLTLPQDK